MFADHGINKGAVLRILHSTIAALLLTAPATAVAQSLLERPPNVSGNWTGAPGTLYFHFLHRFAVSPKPEKKVSNVPTFLLAAGLPYRVLAGLSYSTNSTLAPRFPNEWELFTRWSPLSQDYGAPLDLAGQIGYNNAADGVDGEVSLARKFGHTRIILAGRALSDPLEEGNVRFAVAGGATIRLAQWLALAGDVATLTDRDSTENMAWSAGLHVAIPLTPHTVSFHASNSLITTLQGASRGSNDVRYGFEFTVPLTLRRYFGQREAPVASVVPPPVAPATADTVVKADTVKATPPAAQSAQRVTSPPDSAVSKPATTAPKTDTSRAPARSAPAAPRPAAAPTVSVSIKNVSYLKPRLEITAGTTVVWTNNDQMPHTVTANDRSYDSGLVQPGKTWRHTFTKPGTYAYFCVPHPFMKATVVVR